MNNTQSLIDYILKTQPKVIFWDIGRVFVDVSFYDINHRTAAHFNLEYEPFWQLIRESFGEYVRGNLSNEELDNLFTEKF
jgi:hypothetical protein